VETATSGDQVDVVVNQTPFYGESGGQMGDQGTISGEGYQLEVTDTQKRGEGLFVHRAKVVSGTVSKGAVAQLEVDHSRRAKIRANHSATHLLHEALRRGAWHPCGAEGLAGRARPARFDFSHPSR
jgi:alanyl-tRNA synthetase